LIKKFFFMQKEDFLTFLLFSKNKEKHHQISLKTSHLFLA